MSRLLLTSDLHIGHKAIAKYRPQFATVVEHDDYVIAQYLATVQKRDTVYFLGDVAFTPEAIERIATLPGYKILVLGNHDTGRSRQHTQHLMSVFERVYGLATKKGCWLSHAPIHPAELREKYSIHGHTHDQILQDPRYANICLENTSYKPVLFRDVLDSLQAGKIFTG